MVGSWLVHGSWCPDQSGHLNQPQHQQQRATTQRTTFQASNQPGLVGISIFLLLISLFTNHSPPPTFQPQPTTQPTFQPLPTTFIHLPTVGRQVAVIISNALVMGISTDVDSETIAWDVTEVAPGTAPVGIEVMVSGVDGSFVDYVDEFG